MPHRYPAEVRRQVIEQASAHVTDAPGLYAIYGDASAWRELGLGDPPDERPLYVGKAEASLLSRDLKTHFLDGRTGSSTLRRSLAALLRDRLGLRGIPRNPSKPGRYSNYGLSPQDDAKLTGWMTSNLRLATWEKEGDVELIAIERRLLARWLPPLNLKDVRTPWSPAVSAERRQMAEQARIAGEASSR